MRSQVQLGNDQGRRAWRGRQTSASRSLTPLRPHSAGLPRNFPGRGAKRLGDRRQVLPAALGPPGRLMIKVRPRITATPGRAWRGRLRPGIRPAWPRVSPALSGGPRSKWPPGWCPGAQPRAAGGQDEVQVVAIAPGLERAAMALGLIGDDLGGGNLESSGGQARGPVGGPACARPAPGSAAPSSLTARIPTRKH